MKKFTLMIVALLVAATSMAIGTPVKSSLHNIVKKYNHADLVKHNSMILQKGTTNKGLAKDFVKKASFLKANTVKDAEPATKTLVQTEYLAYLIYGGGFTEGYLMADRNYIIDNNNIMFQVDENIVLEGIIGEGENPYAQYGLEVIKFPGGQVIGNSETNGDYVVKACDFNSTDKTISVNDNDIYAYAQFDEAGDIEYFILNEIIALYNENQGIIYGGVNYSYYPSAIKDDIYSTIITGKTDEWVSDTEQETVPVTINSQALFYDQDSETRDYKVLVKELNAWGVDDVWTCVNLKEDYTGANIDNFQYIGTYTFKDGSNGDIVNAAVKPDYHTDANGLVLAVSTDEQENLVLTASTEAEASVYWLVGFFDDGKTYLINNIKELVITITNELAGIKDINVNNSTRSNAATYNLAGQKVGKDYKGIIIRDGKKFIVK